MTRNCDLGMSKKTAPARRVSRKTSVMIEFTRQGRIITSSEILAKSALGVILEDFALGVTLQVFA